ncbi:alpha/beta fold hydrolase [Pedococcus sp. 5OH_020]|uniref:alpha/beta fold hydrolase n=1 Tax=Pedococcus sp. 5OH_020 TaxID=2989814 RepID=UPI0022E9F735|nr:alpha/beta hydrolase [Pedococcus sp. 5OH_020]
MPGTDLTMTTSDGVHIVFDDEGEGSPFLLVHGYDGLRAHWEFQRDALLAAGHRVVALDQRGHWASDKPLHGLRMSRLGQDLRELIELLDLDDITLVGHSMGVSASLAMFSISGVDPVKRFVAIEQSPKLTNEDGWTWGARGLTWDNVYDMAYRRAVLGQPELEPPMPEGAAMGMTEHTFDHEKVSKLLLDHMVADWRDVLPRIPVPTWVVGGRLSPYYDMDGMEWFAAQVRDSRLTVFENSGHSPHVTEVEEFNRRLLDFVTLHPGAPGPVSQD